MMESGMQVKEIVLDLFCSLYEQPVDIQAAVIDALEDFICEWLLRQKLPCSTFKSWKKDFCGSSNFCNVLMRPCDLLLLFDGSRLLQHLSGFYSASASGESKVVLNLPCTSENSSVATDSNTVDIECLATNKQPNTTSESVLPNDYILIKPPNVEFTDGNLLQLTASVTDLTPGGFSDCTDNDSVDNVSLPDCVSVPESVEESVKVLCHAVEIKEEMPCESVAVRRQRKSKNQVPTADVTQTRSKRQLKKKSSFDGQDKKITIGVKKSVRAAASAKKDPQRTRSKRVVKSNVQTQPSVADNDEGKVKDDIALNGQTVCEICGACVKCLKSHMLKHSDPKHKCPYCPFVSRQLQSVTIHVNRRHTNFRPHLCEECGKTFVKSTLLKEHVREKHYNIQKERRFPCSTCSYVAYTKSILVRHEARHATDRRPEFRCEECGARLMTVFSLKEHMRLSHSEARPFPCALCGFTAKSVKRLRSHMRTHGDKSFECGICFKKFTLRPQLVRHQLVHSGDKPFACPYCSYRCAIVENLRKHCRAVHKLIYPPKKRDVRDELCGPNVSVPLSGASVVAGSGNSDNGSVRISISMEIDSTDGVGQ